MSRVNVLPVTSRNGIVTVTLACMWSRLVLMLVTLKLCSPWSFDFLVGNIDMVTGVFLV